MTAKSRFEEIIPFSFLYIKKTGTNACTYTCTHRHRHTNTDADTQTHTYTYTHAQESQELRIYRNIFINYKIPKVCLISISILKFLHDISEFMPRNIFPLL